MQELLAAGHVAYSKLMNLCVWAKDNAGMGSFYRSQHELIFVFENGEASHRNNVQLGRFGRSRSNVWHYPGVNSFARTTNEGDLLALHPTVKPVALVADAIMDCSARGELVLDSFLGSGTTVIHELTTFPKGKYDDQADSTSLALDWFKNNSTRRVLGLIDYLKREGGKFGAAQQSATIPESRQCPGCNGVMSQPIPGGLRCAQCGAQWPPPGTQQRVQYPTRTDILNGVKLVASERSLNSSENPRGFRNGDVFEEDPSKAASVRLWLPSSLRPYRSQGNAQTATA